MTECEACGGELVLLGTLGTREHFRCRLCGLDCSKRLKVPWPVAAEYDYCPECGVKLAGEQRRGVGHLCYDGFEPGVDFDPHEPG